MKRGLVIGAGALVALAVISGAGVYVLFSSMDSIVKAAVEKVGSEVTQTEVSLGRAEISLTSGKGALLGFRMTNPEGFKSDDAFKFDEVSVVIDTKTIASDPVVIKEIVIANPVITYEIGDKTTNLDVIEQNVGRYGRASAAGTADAAEESAGPNIVIDDLYLQGGTVNVVASHFPDKSLSARLPDLHLTDIGKDGKGATPGEIAKVVMDRLLAEITATVARIDIKEFVDSLGITLDQAVGALGNGTSLRDGVSRLGESVGGAAEKAGKAIENLLGNQDLSPARP